MNLIEALSAILAATIIATATAAIPATATEDASDAGHTTTEEVATPVTVPPTEPPDKAEHKARENVCYNERYVARRVPVAIYTPGSSGVYRYYSASNPQVRYFNSHWYQEWDYNHFTRQWVHGPWIKWDDSLNTKAGVELSGYVFHSYWSSPGVFTTRPVEYIVDDRLRCGVFSELHDHWYDDIRDVGCKILEAAAIVATIVVTVSSGGTALPLAVSVAVIATGSTCGLYDLYQFFVRTPDDTIYDVDEDHWVIETRSQESGLPLKKVIIPDDTNTLMIYGRV